MKAELNTILAALRFYQAELALAGEPPAAVADIACDGVLPAMTPSQIDKLCERLNCGVQLYCYVRVYLRPPGHPKGHPQPAFTHTFVQADSEDTAYHLGNKDPFDKALLDDGYAPANDYVIPCGPMLQAPCEDYAALVVVKGGVADVVEGSYANVRVIDLDNIGAGDSPVELPRGEGFEELVAGTDLEAGIDYAWEK